MLLTESRLRSLSSSEKVLKKATASAILHESVTSTRDSYDIFLSHSKMDSELILGVKSLLEKYGFSVYVDWVDDPLLIRSNVNATSAAVIRGRMRSSTMLIYAHTLNSSSSRWCPWELGFFDGIKSGNVFIMPVSTDEKYGFDGQEYLGLYPYVDEAQSQLGEMSLWINTKKESPNLKTALSRVYAPM